MWLCERLVRFNRGSQRPLYLITLILNVALISDFARDHRAIAQEPSSEQIAEGISYTAIDLYKYANRGHLQQVGPMLSPGAPGWGRHSHSTHLSGAFRAPESYKGKTVSWIEGRGGTIHFPISESETRLEELLIWLHPIAAHQVVSVFVDEVLVKNLSLFQKGRYYRLKLPHPLERGEHSLRLYFKFTRPAPWGGRTPGAVGPLSFVPLGQDDQMLDQWTEEIVYQQRKWGALLAPPPSTWRFYFIPPIAAEFKTTLYLPPFGPSTRFQILIASDELEEQLLVDEMILTDKNKEGISRKISLSLSPYIGKAIRLTLKTEKIKDHPLAKQRKKLTDKAALNVGWLSPRVDSYYPPPSELPKVKRLLIWAIDGLTLDLLIKEPLLQNALPSLKMLINNGVTFSRLWTDQLSQRGGHLNLLQPIQGAPSLLKSIKASGGWSAYIGSSLADPPLLDRSFDATDFVDQEEEGDNPFKALLVQVQQMSKLGQLLKDRALVSSSQGSELIYIHSPNDPRLYRSTPFALTHGEQAWLEAQQLGKAEHQQLREQISYLKEIDYSLAQLLGTLSVDSKGTDSALLIMGTLGFPPRLMTPTPKIFQQHIESSAILLHPRLDQAKGQNIDRAHIISLSDTIASLLAQEDEELGTSTYHRGSLSPFILNKWPLPAIVDSAKRSAHVLFRLKDYYLLEKPIGQPVLWHMPSQQAKRSHQNITNLAQSSPILLRTLRDGLSVSPLFEGLK